MTIRTVRIISSVDKGMSQDCGLSIDCTPDRTVYKLEGVDCTVEEFLEWFLDSAEGEAFCATACGTLIDIGGSSINTELGSEISIDYNTYFNYWLKRSLAWLERQVDIDTRKAYERLGIERRYRL